MALKVKNLISHLNGREQRVFVEFLELGSDVQQVDFRPAHHDPVQSGLISSCTLNTRFIQLTYKIYLSTRW